MELGYTPANLVSTHSRPKAAGNQILRPNSDGQFQHTAARRRLGSAIRLVVDGVGVSTHSRPKAAGIEKLYKSLPPLVSTHSRPKAAGADKSDRFDGVSGFNTQPPEGGWGFGQLMELRFRGFNTQPPEGGWNAPPQN